MEEIGKNCSAVFDIVTLSMRDFYLTRSAASVIVENLVRVKILKFEGVCIHRDGINRLFNDCLEMQEIQLCSCFLMEDDDLSNFKATINVNFALTKWHGFQEWGFCNSVEESTKSGWRNWLRRGVTVPMMFELNVTFKVSFLVLFDGSSSCNWQLTIFFFFPEIPRYCLLFFCNNMYFFSCFISILVSYA